MLKVLKGGSGLSRSQECVVSVAHLPMQASQAIIRASTNCTNDQQVVFRQFIDHLMNILFSLYKIIVIRT